MLSLSSLIKRNCKLFFKDKGMLFTSLITPAILLVLYVTFLANVFRSSFTAVLPEGVAFEEKVLSGLVGGQLVSSLIAVSCVTVAFCSNFLMVFDKTTGALKDMSMTPVKKSTLALGYYISTVISTLIVCVVALCLCFIYLAFTGWFLSLTDVLMLFVDMILLVLFGSALSSIINIFLSSQGQISAVGTIVSAGYGFICGAYMPMANFSEGLKNVLSFLPGTYGTSLVRNHALRGVFEELSKTFPSEIVTNIKDGIDCNLYFFGNNVGVSAMFAILAGSVLLLIGVYILLHQIFSAKKK